MRWRQIVQASDGIEADIGETAGEVKFPKTIALARLPLQMGEGARRAGEGPSPQAPPPELAEPKSPHPAFGHLTPIRKSEREKAN